ncbi:MAG: hypothetical protein ACK5MR_00325 [Cumulibacter sp.]
MTLQIHGVSGVDEIRGALDGQLAPMADPRCSPVTTALRYTALQDPGPRKDRDLSGNGYPHHPTVVITQPATGSDVPVVSVQFSQQ